MSITVEFYGIPRQRAGVPATTATSRRLGDLFLELAERFPGLADCCFNQGRLQQGYIANLNGKRFVSEPELVLNPGDSVLILTADAGG